MPHMSEAPLGHRKVSVLPDQNRLWAPIEHSGQCALEVAGQLAHASVLGDRITLVMENGEAFFGRLPVATAKAL